MSSTTREIQRNPQPQDVARIRVLSFIAFPGAEASQFVAVRSRNSWTIVGDHSQTEEVFLLSLSDETDAIKSSPASKLAVGSLSRKTYNKVSDVAGMCPICLEEFDDGKEIATLPCGHEFDDKCLGKWFMSNHVCPLCRLELPVEN